MRDPEIVSLTIKNEIADCESLMTQIQNCKIPKILGIKRTHDKGYRNHTHIVVVWPGPEKTSVLIPRVLQELLHIDEKDGAIWKSVCATKKKFKIVDLEKFSQFYLKSWYFQVSLLIC